MKFLKKQNDFIVHQLAQIRSGGIPVLFIKISRVVMGFLVFPLSILVRLLRPFAVIRFGSLDSERIGHFAMGTELYLCERELNKMKTVDIFYHSGFISNRQLKKMWDRELYILNFAKWMHLANRYLPGGSSHNIESNSGRDVDGLLERTKAHLSFTSEEDQFGMRCLEELGIPQRRPFVCIYGRDPAYLESIFPSNNWSYHDYRDCRIQNFLPAANELTRRGYFVVRMGSIVAEELNTDNPMIIDYAVNGRSDFMDIYLGAKCSFFLGVPGGMVAIPMIFRRPVAYVNSIPIGYIHFWNPDEISIIKKLKERKTGRLLSLRDIMGSMAGIFYKSAEYEKMGIEVVENTPEEILALAVEMDERLKGSWKENGEDVELQRRFWTLFKPGDPRGKIASRIGTAFLRENQYLLDQGAG